MEYTILPMVFSIFLDKKTGLCYTIPILCQNAKINYSLATLTPPEK